MVHGGGDSEGGSAAGDGALRPDGLESRRLQSTVLAWDQQAGTAGSTEQRQGRVAGSFHFQQRQPGQRGIQLRQQLVERRSFLLQEVQRRFLSMSDGNGNDQATLLMIWPVSRP